MISKQYRFHGYGSLKYLFSKGRAVHATDLTVKFIDNPRRKKPRFTVIVSKKVNKKAVVRNRIRRRLYELIRINQESIDPLYDIAVIVRSDSVATMSSGELAEQLQALFVRANVIISAKN